MKHSEVGAGGFLLNRSVSWEWGGYWDGGIDFSSSSSEMQRMKTENENKEWEDEDKCEDSDGAVWTCYWRGRLEEVTFEEGSVVMETKWCLVKFSLVAVIWELRRKYRDKYTHIHTHIYEGHLFYLCQSVLPSELCPWHILGLTQGLFATPVPDIMLNLPPTRCCFPKKTHLSNTSLGVQETQWLVAMIVLQHVKAQWPSGNLKVSSDFLLSC